ncbi:MAG: hypothetical protein ACD_77C00236G0009 [uncultured bacterium]|nr:MAG: hypothetical protein ACD_77C00236G0009 [uncultured bacterium]
MIYTENALNVLTAKTYKGIGRAWIVKNLNYNIKVDVFISRLNKDAKEDYQITQEDFEKKKIIVINAIKKAEAFMDGFVAIGDTDFPPFRGIVKNSEQPIFLFYKGNLSLLSATNKNVAVIGLLNPDNDIIKIEKEVVGELVNSGVAIVSGLALGCDTIAHKQALDSNGKAIAILPSPLNNVLPATNKVLANEILEKGGLLITEYLTDAKSKMELASRYQERDRLQALFSDCIVLSASYAKNDLGNDSGSRLAMGYAFDYSIPRAVIYDFETDIDNPKFELNRLYIREQKDIIVINRSNLIESVRKIVAKRPLIMQNQPIQKNLFG